MDYFNKVKANAEAMWAKYMGLPSVGLKVAVAFTAIAGLYVAAQMLPILIAVVLIVAAFMLFTPHNK